MSTAAARSGITRTKGYEYYVNKFEEWGYTVLTTKEEFGGKASDWLEMKCEQDHISKKRPKTCNDTTGRGYACGKCVGITKSKMYSKSDEEVKDMLKNTTLTWTGEKYQSIKHKIELTCQECGHVFKKTLSNVIWCDGWCPACNMTVGEKMIKKWLDDNKEWISYESQFISKPDPYDPRTHCKDKGYLRFDFMIEPHDGLQMLVEYDGAQHFESVDFFGGEDTLENRKRKDIVKNYHCWLYGIPLLRIHCLDIKKIPQLLESFVAQNRYKIPKNPIYYSSNHLYDDLHNMTIENIYKQHSYLRK